MRAHNLNFVHFQLYIVNFYIAVFCRRTPGEFSFHDATLSMSRAVADSRREGGGRSLLTGCILK